MLQRSWSYSPKEYSCFDLSEIPAHHIQCLHLMYAEVAWVLISSGTQFQPQIVLNPDYHLDYLSLSYDYGYIQ